MIKSPVRRNEKIFKFWHIYSKREKSNNHECNSV